MNTTSLSTRARKGLSLLLVSMGLAAASPGYAAGEVKAVATFSILGDLVRQVGGDRLELTVLVGPGADSHVFQPSPSQARTVRQAQVLFSNGLNYETWLRRLMKASQFKGRDVVVSRGVKVIQSAGGQGHGHDHGHAHDEADPHAWQNVANVKRYVDNIAEALCDVDSEGCSGYQRNAKAYQAELDLLDAEVRDAWRPVPVEQRKVITSHDAFAYYGQAYQVRFLAAQGANTGSEASVKGVARLVRQIKAEKIKALFVENISDPRLIEQIGRETGVKPAGDLYSDSLTDSKGPAPSYVALMKQNTKALVRAVQGSHD